MQTKNKLENVLARTGGRFFGVHTASGEAINTQSARLSDHFLTLVDRNSGKTRRIARNSVSKIALGGTVYSV